MLFIFFFLLAKCNKSPIVRRKSKLKINKGRYGTILYHRVRSSYLTIFVALFRWVRVIAKYEKIKTLMP